MPGWKARQKGRKKMRRLVIYWENDSSELFLLNDVATMTCGNDGMEVLVSDFIATRIREIVAENPDCLTLHTDESATSADVEAAMEWYDMARPPRPGEEADIQTVLQVLGTDDYHEVTHVIEAELTREDCELWHTEAEASENVETLIDVFGAFQIYGMPNSQYGEEPLNVIWPA
jgi:hypothetical protein